MHAMEEFGRDCCIRGYHVYKETWRAAIGEESLGSTATDHLRCLQQQSLVRTDFGKGDLSDQADRPWA